MEKNNDDEHANKDAQLKRIFSILRYHENDVHGI